MLWGQSIVVYTDHKNLIQDALRSTSDRVYRWRLLLEEYGPEIIYIKVIHNMVADAISRLEIKPRNFKQEKQNWMIRTKICVEPGVLTQSEKTKLLIMFLHIAMTTKRYFL